MSSEISSVGSLALQTPPPIPLLMPAFIIWCGLVTFAKDSLADRLRVDHLRSDLFKHCRPARIQSARERAQLDHDGALCRSARIHRVAPDLCMETGLAAPLPLRNTVMAPPPGDTVQSWMMGAVTPGTTRPVRRTLKSTQQPERPATTSLSVSSSLDSSRAERRPKTLTRRDRGKGPLNDLPSGPLACLRRPPRFSLSEPPAHHLCRVP